MVYDAAASPGLHRSLAGLTMYSHCVERMGFSEGWVQTVVRKGLATSSASSTVLYSSGTASRAAASDVVLYIAHASCKTAPVTLHELLFDVVCHVVPTIWAGAHQQVDSPQPPVSTPPTRDSCACACLGTPFAHLTGICSNSSVLLLICLSQVEQSSYRCQRQSPTEWTALHLGQWKIWTGTQLGGILVRLQ